MARFDLGSSARAFAGLLTTVLNGTVCQGISISAAKTLLPNLFTVGYKLKSDDFVRITPIPLTIDAKPPTGYLGLSYTLIPDDEGQHLTVRTAVMTFGVDENTDNPILHYDYERNKADGYPDAHLQIGADPPGWAALCSRRGISKPFSAVHLPLGNRRFRPTLEDLIRSLIVEGLVEYRDGWEAVLDNSQQAFADTQLRAAIRRNPEVARQAVAELDIN